MESWESSQNTKSFYYVYLVSRTVDPLTRTCYTHPAGLFALAKAGVFIVYNHPIVHTSGGRLLHRSRLGELSAAAV